MNINRFFVWNLLLILFGLNHSTYSQSTDGGIISFVNGDTILNICLPQDTSLVVDVVLSDNVGENSLWVVTDENNIIIDTLSIPTFRVANYPPVEYNIQHLSALMPNQDYIGVHKDSLQGVFDFSNPVKVIKTIVTQGLLSLVEGDSIIGCNGDGVLDTLIFGIEGHNGLDGSFFVTDTMGNIVKVLQDSLLISDSIALPFCYVYHVTFQHIDNLESGINISDLIGCYELSNRLLITKSLIEGGDIWLLDDRTIKTICVGDGASDAFITFIDNEIGANSKWIVSDIDGTIMAVITFNTFNLEGIDPGHCQIFHISYDGTVENLSAGNNLNDLSGCFDLSNPIDVIRIAGETSIGQLELTSPNQICSGDGIPDTISVGLSAYLGDSINYLLVDKSETILSISDTSYFELEGFSKSDSLTVFAISYLEGLDRLEVGLTLDKIEGCYSLSNPIGITIGVVDGGTISFGNSITTTVICSDDQIPDTTYLTVNDTCGAYYTYFIFDNNGTILARFETDTLDLDAGAQDTSYLVLVASTDSIPGIVNINEIEGCFNTSNTLIILNSSGEVLANDLNLESPYTVCLPPGLRDSLFLERNDDIGIILRYVLTDLNDTIIGIFDSDTIDLSILDLNQYKLYNFAGSNFIDGLEINKSLPNIAGCYDLSEPILLNLQEVNGGILSIDSLNSEFICLGNDGNESILMQLDSAIGQTQFYVITDSLGRIVDASTNPLLTIDRYDLDSILVWSLLYNGLIEGLIRDSSIYNLSGCFDLSEPILITPYIVDGGLISFKNQPDSLIFCSALDSGFVEVHINGERGDSIYLAIANKDGKFIHIIDSLKFKPSDFLEEELILVVYAGIDSFFIEDSIVKSLDDCFTSSNFIRLINKFPIGGALYFDDTLKSKQICLIPNEEMNIDLSLAGSRGTYREYVILNKELDTVLVSTTPVINSALLSGDSLAVFAVSYADSLHIADSPCFAFSDTIELIIHRINGGALTFNDTTIQKVACLGEPIRIELENSLGEESFYLLLDKDSILLQFDVEYDSLNLLTLDTGIYNLVHISAVDFIIDSSFLGKNLLELEGCLHLSNLIQFTLDEGLAEILSLQLLDVNVSCENAIVANYTFSFPDTSKNELFYLIVDTSDVIVEVLDTSSFNYAYDQTYKVFLINFKTPPIPFGVGFNINQLRGCYGLSSAVVLPPIFNDAGSISFENNELERDFCGVGISVDTLDILLDHLGHINRYWVVTNTIGEVLDTFSNLPILIDNNGPDSCLIYNLAYFNEETVLDFDISITTLGGCYELSNPLLVTKSLIRGGEIFANGGKEVTICTGDQTIDQVNIDISFSSGDGSAWVITDEFGNITSLSTVAPNNFNNLPGGICFLRHIRYQPGNVQGLFLGVNVESIDGCFEFSDSIQINKNVVNGGSLVVKDSLTDIQVCIDDGAQENLTPQLSGQLGDSTSWVITNNFGEIVQLGVQPPFNFEGEDPGQCFIWNVSYTGEIEGLENGNFLSDLEGCLATSNPIRIRKRGGLDCLTSTEDKEDDFPFIIYPNPTSGELFINNINKENVRVSLFNLNGQLKHSETIGINLNETIDISHLSPGLFYIRFEWKSKSYIVPIVKL